MNETSHSHDDIFPEQPSSIEAIVLAAGNYVVVSDDLRPRTIEAACDEQSIRVARRRIGWISAAILLSVSLITPTVRSWKQQGLRSSSPTATEIHQTALRYAAEANVSPDWALQKVFEDLRQSHARKFQKAMQ